MTEPEIYVIGMLIVILITAYGFMRWNHHIVQSHRLPQKGDRGGEK